MQMFMAPQRGKAANPFTLWVELSLKTNEMLVASARVIDHRTKRMVLAGPTPNVRDRREFTLMGREKVEAAIESTHAMASQLTNTTQEFWTRTLGQFNSGSQRMMSLAGSRTPSQALERQTRLLNTMIKSLLTATQVSHTAARFAQSGLLPVHSRATANARRLCES